jgi:hypothetical protein
MVLRLLRALPGVPGLLATIARQTCVFANLTPASGCQDHTAWPSAQVLPVSQHSRGHRHLPHVRDVGQRPSHRDRMGLRKQVIWGARKQKYFFEQVLTRLLFFRIADLPVVSNLPQSQGYTLLVVPANARDPQPRLCVVVPGRRSNAANLQQPVASALRETRRSIGSPCYDGRRNNRSNTRQDDGFRK